MEEKRSINRIDFTAKSVVVDCETQEQYFVEVENVSPLGIGFRMKPGSPNLKGKAVIVVSETLIMYADVARQVEQADGTFIVGVTARKFTPDVLEYLFERIALPEDKV